MRPGVTWTRSICSSTRIASRRTPRLPTTSGLRTRSSATRRTRSGGSRIAYAAYASEGTLPISADIEPRILQAEQRLHDRGVQQVTILSAPDGATVTLDGRRIGVTPWSGEAVPGTHQVALELRGFSDATSKFELPLDHAVDVPVQLEPEGPKTATAAVSTADFESFGSRTRRGRSPESDRSRGRRSASELLGSARRSASNSPAPPPFQSAHDETNIEGKDRFDQATTYQTVSRVSLGVGSAFAVAGGRSSLFRSRVQVFRAHGEGRHRSGLHAALSAAWWCMARS